MHFKKCTFSDILPFFRLTLNDYCSVIFLGRMDFLLPKIISLLLIFTWAKTFWGQNYFWSKKMHFKNALFPIFDHFFINFN